MEQTNQGGGNKKYIVAIVLLLLINVGLIYQLWSENKAKNDLTVQKTELETEFKSLNDTLETKRLEIESLIESGNIQDSTILAQRDELEAKQQEIQRMLSSGKMTKNELAKAQKLISQYEASIAELQKRVEELAAKNQQLTNENEQLSTDLSSQKQANEAMSADLAVKTKKVELGSLLQPRNIVVEGVEKKKNGKEVVTKRVKSTQSLRVTFETGENKVLEAGNLSLYLRIISPKGETISVPDQGSGAFNLSESGEAMQFTKKADFDYSQTNKKIVVYWGQNIKDAGTYKVEIYQSGYLIGKGSVELK